MIFKTFCCLTVRPGRVSFSQSTFGCILLYIKIIVYKRVRCFLIFSFLGELIAPQPNPPKPVSRKPNTLGNLEMPSLITENKKNRYKSTEYERIIATNEQGEKNHGRHAEGTR